MTDMPYADNILVLASSSDEKIKIISAFLIFPEETNNYNIDSLNGQAQHKKLKESVEAIQRSIGDRIFQTVLR